MVRDMLVFKILKLLEKRAQRFQKIYDKDQLRNVLMRTLSEADEVFIAKKSPKEIERLIYLQYHFRKRIKGDRQSAGTRSLFLKLFKSDDDGVSAVKIAIGTSLQHSYEAFEEKHIYRALVSLLPGIRIIPGSFYSCYERSHSFLFCYLEIERLRGTNVTSKDIHLLRTRLPLALEQSIQPLAFSVVFSYNEEEMYKSVIQLARELRSGEDLPQVSISFQGLTRDVLRFNVGVVRARKKNLATFQHHAHLLPSSTRLTLKKVIPLGVLQKGKVKEAVIFSVEIDGSLFLRKDWSVDLNQARRFVANLIEQFFGPFRDYNGGLLSQQNKQLEEIKKRVRKKHEDFYYPLIQEMFLNFSPPRFQALVPISIAQRLSSFLISFFKKENSSEAIISEEKNDRGSLFILIRSASYQPLQILIEELKNLENKISSASGYSYFEFERMYYFYFVDLDPVLDSKIMAHFKNALKNNNNESRKVAQKILKLNFAEGDPPSLNPQLSIDQRCRCLGKALFEGLTRLNAEGVPEPAAAKEIRISPCNTIYTFILRKHYWSNGDEVSAYDFEEAWKRAIDPSSQSLRSDLFYIIKNAKHANQGLKPSKEVKVTAVNAKTLVVELEYPAFYFLHLIAHPVFSPLCKREEEPYHFNGPFLLREWERGQFLHLMLNPYYWDKKNVQFKDILISMVKKTESICQLFEKEELDWLGEPFTTLKEETFARLKRKNWQRKEVSQVYWIYLNTRLFPLYSSNIRKALGCAIDRAKITGLLKSKPLFFNHYLTSPSNERVHWDGNAPLAQAFFQEGLKELGIERGAFPKLTFYWSMEGEEQIVQMIQKQIQTVLQIDVELQRKEWNDLSYLLDKREYQMSSCYRSLPYLYSRSYLELFQESSNLYNSSQWENSVFKKLLDKALRSVCSEEREKHLEEAEQFFLQEMPVIPVIFPEYLYLLNSKIDKVAIASNGDVDLKLILPKQQKCKK
jgi:oligopeptide transport system substrate-binding protein